MDRDYIPSKTSQILDELIEIRRQLHRNPELSFSEKETSSFIRKKLEEWQINYEYPFVEHGIMAVIEGENVNGPVLALRADMDALPIQENSGLEFASINPGVMHACGHDIHMTCMLGAAKILSESKNHFNGKVLIIFQPGEEKLPGGAKLMMEEGVFSKHKPDMMLAQHVLPEMNAGEVGFKAGEYMASSDEIFITIKGNGGHGALPEKINDPILMAAHMLISLQQEINRKAPKKIPTVLSFGKVEANGAVNIIPDIVKLEGTFRTMNEEWRALAHKLIKQITEGIASSMGGEVEVNIMGGYPSLFNNPEITHKAKEFAIDLLGKEKVNDMDIRMTAEDFAWFSNTYPAMLYRIGVKNPNEDKTYRLHSDDFVADENAIRTGIEMMSWLALRFLNNY